MDLLLIVGLPLAAVLAAIVFGIVVPRARRAHRARGPIVVVPFSYDNDVPARPIRTPPRTPTQDPRARPVTPTPPFSQAAPAAASPSPAAPLREPPFVTPRREAATGTDGLAHEPHPAAEPPLRLEHVSDSRTGEHRTPLRVHRPTPVDGTLQFLPGRFDIVEGRDIGQEIRFVKAPTGKTEITFGRSDGAPYKHVQLHEPTVSRMHARITWENRRWRLTNLSATNPVVVNGTPLDGDGASHVLAEGDRVEMGEVALRFRAK